MDYSKFGVKNVSKELGVEHVTGNPDFMRLISEMKFQPRGSLSVVAVDFPLTYIDNREPECTDVVDYYVEFAAEFRNAAEAMLHQAVEIFKTDVLLVVVKDYENCIRYILHSLFSGRSPIAKEFGLRVGAFQGDEWHNGNVCRIEFSLIVRKMDTPEGEKEAASAFFCVALTHGVVDKEAGIINFDTMGTIVIVLDGENLEENKKDIDSGLKL